MRVKFPGGGETPERTTRPEHIHKNRRKLLKAAGFLGVTGLLEAGVESKNPYPAKRNPEFTLDRPITEEWAAEGYNNFYEFDQEDKQNVKNLVGPFKISPWTFEVSGLVNKPKTF